MIVILSPAKTLDYDSDPQTTTFTEPELLDDAAVLIDVLQEKNAKEIKSLMSISDKLADLNIERYRTFETPFSTDNAKQALLAFKGDVYRDIEVEEYSDEDFVFAQQHLRILSGLYGVLRPLDLMQPYRLEMGTKLKTERGKNLYEFWSEKIANELNDAISALHDHVLLNLASQEYFKSVDRTTLDAEIVDVAFLENKGGVYKIVSFFAKRARGTMANWIVRNRIKTVEELKEFAEDGYYYSEEKSRPKALVFLRDGKDAA